MTRKILYYFILIFDSVFVDTSPESGETNSVKVFGDILLYKPFQNDQQLVELANEMAKEENYNEAILFYSKAIVSIKQSKRGQNPSVATYYALRGNCYVEIGNNKKALKDFERAVSLFTDPQNKELVQEPLLLDDVKLVKLGKRLFNTWKFREAIWCYTEAINRNPSEPFYYRLRGDCHLRMQNLEEAIVDLRTAVQKDPSNKNGRLLLSQAFYNAGEYNEAIDVILILDDAADLVNLGDKFMHSKKFKEAFRSYTEAIRKNTKNPEYYGKRGLCLLEMRDWDNAVSDFKEQLSMDPHNTNAWYHLIKGLLYSGKKTEALKELGVLTDTELLELGKDFAEMHLLEEAILVYTEAIRKKPNEASYYRRRGDCNLRKYDINAAISDFKKAVKIDQNEDERIRLSELLFDCERYEEAISEISALDDIQLMVLGHKFLDLNKFEEAIQCYTEAIDKNSENFVCYEKRGYCHWKLRHLEDAIFDLKKSLQLVPAHKPAQVKLYRILMEAGHYDQAKKVLENIDEKSRRYFQGQESYKYKQAHQKTIQMEEATKRITYDRQNSERQISKVDQ